MAKIHNAKLGRIMPTEKQLDKMGALFALRDRRALYRDWNEAVESIQSEWGLTKEEMDKVVQNYRDAYED
jgi:hypothetical protein